MSKVKVSVMCLVYNHEKYIRQALDGILMQKTDFDYEVIVNDDASTDGSADIIKEYQKQYPDKIKAILRKENLYSKGVCWQTELYKHFEGEYVAICEGDDYWTDCMKLQKQVKLLDNHPEYAACGHNVHVVNENEEIQYNSNIGALHYVDIDTIKDIRDIYFYGRFSHTCSLVFRRKIFDDMNTEQINDYKSLKITGDIKLCSLIMANGDFYQFKDIMSCYRHITSHGDSWSAQNKNRNMAVYFNTGCTCLEKFLTKYYFLKNTHHLIKTIYFSQSIRLYRQSPSTENKDIMTKILLDWSF